MTVEWREVKGYGGKYKVNCLGEVRNAKGRLLKPFPIHQGYLVVDLFDKGKRKHVRLNRLVAEAFLPNPENKPEVNHKNGDKTDNAAANLEWTTKSENMIHAYQSGLQKKGRYPVRKVICVDDGKIFCSIGEAARAYNMNPRTVAACCQRESIGIKTFRYWEDRRNAK